MNIAEKFSLPPVAEMMLVARGNYKEHPDYTMVNPDLIVGLELEIEGWPYYGEENRFRGFSFTTDGSLRGPSIEAITKPMYSKYVPEKLEAFFEKFNVTRNNYSERCSIHVHVNCQDMNSQEVASICLLYQVFERAIFAFIGNDRADNIFCVPWSQCAISKQMIRSLINDPDYGTRNWQKYTALNLLPLREKGTLEFRHMEGTCDVRRITTWVNIIGSIVKFARGNKHEQVRELITTLNTTSAYEAFMASVFGSLVTEFSDLHNLLSQGVIDCKIALLERPTLAESLARVTAREQPVSADTYGVNFTADLPPLRRAPPLVREVTQAQIDTMMHNWHAETQAARTFLSGEVRTSAQLNDTTESF